MNPLRLVLVTRRFWPLVDECENLLARLSAELNRHDVSVTVLTARMQADWPRQLVCQGVPVVRLWHPPLRACGAFRYRRALARWLTAHAQEFDLAYVCGLQDDAHATLEASRRAGFPVVLRPQHSGLAGDCHWQLEASRGARIKRRCFQSAALVASSRAIERELIAAGYPRERIVYVPNGVELPPQRSAAGRIAARTALAEEHVWLELLPQSPLVLAVGPLEESQGYEHLLRGWPQIVAHWPNAKLWIVGHGSRRGALLTQIESLGMSSWVLLPGVFDELDDLLSAADLFVLPALEEASTPALLQAMAAGLPIVATDIPANRELLEQNRQALLVPAEDAGALVAAVAQILQEPETARQLGCAARERVEREFTMQRLVQDHVQLFARLMEHQAARDVKHRILHIIDRLQRDGPSHQLSLLARGLPRNEFDVHVCALGGGNPLANELQAAGIPVTALNRRWQFDPLALWRLEQLIAHLQPEIVQTWQFDANSYGRIAARRCGIANVIAVEHRLEAWKLWPERQLDLRLAAYTRQFVVNSPVMRDDCVAHGLPAEKFEVIASGVAAIADCGLPNADCAAAREQLLADLELPADVRLFCAVGPLRSEENLQDAIWTADIAKILYKNVHLLIVGDGPQRRRLERFAASIRIPERVHFLGDRADVPRLLSFIDLFLLASEHEGVPFSALQALAAGVPVVATDTPAHRQLMANDVHGLLVPPGDRAGFARAVHRLIEHPELSHRLAAAGQQRVLEHYRAETMVQRFADLYRNLLANTPHQAVGLALR